MLEIGSVNLNEILKVNGISCDLFVCRKIIFLKKINFKKVNYFLKDKIKKINIQNKIYIAIKSLRIKFDIISK